MAGALGAVVSMGAETPQNSHLGVRTCRPSPVLPPNPGRGAGWRAARVPETPRAALLLTPVDVKDDSVGWRGLRVPHPSPEPLAGLAPRWAL